MLKARDTQLEQW